MDDAIFFMKGPFMISGKNERGILFAAPAVSAPRPPGGTGSADAPPALSYTIGGGVSTMTLVLNPPSTFYDD
jgi:hypothetical protein